MNKKVFDKLQYISKKPIINGEIEENILLDDEAKEILQEIERLNNIINESAEEILKELEENHHLSYGVALAIRQKLLDYQELKGVDK